MNNEAKIAKIIETIEAGNTVYFTTALRSYPVNSRTLNKFRNSGYDLFQAREDGIYMLNGRKYLCMSGCKITFAPNG